MMLFGNMTTCSLARLRLARNASLSDIMLLEPSFPHILPHGPLASHTFSNNAVSFPSLATPSFACGYSRSRANTRSTAPAPDVDDGDSAVGGGNSSLSRAITSATARPLLNRRNTCFRNGSVDFAGSSDILIHGRPASSVNFSTPPSAGCCAHAASLVPTPNVSMLCSATSPPRETYPPANRDAGTNVPRAEIALSSRSLLAITLTLELSKNGKPVFCANLCMISRALHDRSARSPESSRMPSFNEDVDAGGGCCCCCCKRLLARRSAHATRQKLGTPERSVSYVSTRAMKVIGKARAYEINAASSPSCVS
mmetsp:Transcript_3496/g.7578  ORF Transcript_3496/g.7578 Transcript_3496/m.7578 type:complete len:311 (+) Transcript_3496:178-1110(+)